MKFLPRRCARTRQNGYPIIHCDSRSVGTVQRIRFLVTGNNDKLTITELDTAIRSIGRESWLGRVARTHGQTAVRDDRAALGQLASPCRLFRSAWLLVYPKIPTVTLVTPVLRQLEQLQTWRAKPGLCVQLNRTDCGWGQYAHPPTGHRSSSC